MVQYVLRIKISLLQDRPQHIVRLIEVKKVHMHLYSIYSAEDLQCYDKGISVINTFLFMRVPCIEHVAYTVLYISADI